MKPSSFTAARAATMSFNSSGRKRKGFGVLFEVVVSELLLWWEICQFSILTFHVTQAKY